MRSSGFQSAPATGLPVIFCSMLRWIWSSKFDASMRAIVGVRKLYSQKAVSNCISSRSVAPSTQPHPVFAALIPLVYSSNRFWTSVEATLTGPR